MIFARWSVNFRLVIIIEMLTREIGSLHQPSVRKYVLVICMVLFSAFFHVFHMVSGNAYWEI